nr:Chain V, GUK-holder, isoform A [Drosophila melanogaster]
LPSFETAL